MTGPTPPASVAQTRFNSCRWQRPAEGDQPACCGHRDVLPMAGTSGFNPESWCLDCGYFKMKRAPKPRPAPPPPSRWD
jgi:hypothetical protein